MVDPFTMVVNSPNHMYLAQGLSQKQAHQEGTESLQIIKVSLRKALQLMEERKITHSATCVAILKIALLSKEKK